MTLDERVNVSIQCDSFFLTINETKAAKPIFNQIKSLLNLPKRFDNEIWMMVTLVGKALKIGCRGSQITLSTGHYKTSNYYREDKGDTRKLNRDRVKQVILEMEKHNLLDFYIGYKDVVLGVSIISCVLFNKVLIDMFPLSIIKSYSDSISLDEMVEVKDPVTKEKFVKLTRFKGVGKHKNFMLEYNNLLKESDIRKGNRKCFVQYKQVFSKDLEGAGRIYSFGSFQTMNGCLRRTITINGEEVTEVDLRANHISMIYLLNGIVIDEAFDCYYIEIEGFTYKDLRNLCKMAIMCMINCSRWDTASTALNNVVKEDKESKEPYLQVFHTQPLDFFKKVVKMLIDKHSRINFFDKRFTWDKLQRLDSSICEKVLEHFKKKKEIVLGWHDSWVIRKSLQKELIDVVKDSWCKVFGTYANCFIKVEF